MSFGDISELLQEKLLPGRVHDVVNPRLSHLTVHTVGFTDVVTICCYIVLYTS